MEGKIEEKKVKRKIMRKAQKQGKRKDGLEKKTRV